MGLEALGSTQKSPVAPVGPRSAWPQVCLSKQLMWFLRRLPVFGLLFKFQRQKKKQHTISQRYMKVVKPNRGSTLTLAPLCFVGFKGASPGSSLPVWCDEPETYISLFFPSAEACARLLSANEEGLKMAL